MYEDTFVPAENQKSSLELTFACIYIYIYVLYVYYRSLLFTEVVPVELEITVKICGKNS